MLVQNCNLDLHDCTLYNYSMCPHVHVHLGTDIVVARRVDAHLHVHVHEQQNDSILDYNKSRQLVMVLKWHKTTWSRAEASAQI